MSKSPARYVLVLLVIISATLVACGFGDRNLPENDSPPGWSSDCADCNASDDRDASPDDGDDQPDPSPKKAVSEICQPRPPRVSLDDRPELPDDPSAMTCGQLETSPEETGSAEGETARRVDWTMGDRRLVKRVESSRRGLERRVEFVFRDDGTIESVERFRPDSPAAYRRLAQRTRWQFDPQGRLVERDQVVAPQSASRDEPDPDFEADDPVSTSDLEQRWRGDELVERRLRTKARGGRQRTYRWQWFYRSDGRLQRTEFESSDGADGRVEWTYDAGRPVRAERFVDGTRRVAQTWTYREDGTLERRKVLVDDRDEPGPPLTDAQTLDRRNRFGRRVSYHRLQGPVPGFDSTGREECRQLPGDVSHGYDVDSPAYRTGWEGKLELETVGLAYGSAYVRSWRYGHGGMMMGEGNFEGTTDLRATIEYDRRGRMTRESTSFVPYRPPSEEETSAKRSPVDRTRTRTFDGGKLVADRLVRGRADGEGTSLLRFRRDDRGRLERRELYRDGDLVGAQNYGWDAAGNWTSLTVESRRRGASADDSSELEPFVTLRRRVDSEGRTTRLEHDYDAKSGPRIETWTYGEHGLVRHRTGDQNEFGKREFWERDEMGRVLSYRFVNELREEKRVDVRRHRYTCRSDAADDSLE